jgi:Zn-dependent protease
MLRFRIGSIPIEVRPSHLLVAGLLAWHWMPSAAARSPQAVPALLIGSVVVFVSILVHELGHALMARAFGYQPQIVIEWFGGHTQPNAGEPIPWVKDILLTAAGPLFGFVLGVLAVVGLFLLTGGLDVGRDPAAPVMIQALRFFAEANIAWAVLNLIPVSPLDGGRISNAIFVRVFGPRGALGSQGLSLVICVAGVAWSITANEPFLAIFLAMFGIRAVQIIAAVLRGEIPLETSPQPSDLAFAQAAALFQQKRLEEAERVATRALQGDPPPPRRTQARLHHLLGWIAVKDGRGREALDHFARMDQREVEAHALAAAFALAGDDERALPLWERAYRLSNDRTILHEWAGTLIRLGRSADARAIAGVDMRQALRAAERVLSIRGDHLGAARLGESALAEFPAPELAYDTACSLARAGLLDRAQAMLERAAELGFRDARFAEGDADLAPLHPTPAFRDWITRLNSARS